MAGTVCAGRYFTATTGRKQRRGLRYLLLPTLPTTALCPATRASAEIISSTGNIFSCSEYPLVPEAERSLPLAHIDDADLPVFRPEGPFDDWNDTVEAGKTWCRSCPLLPTCGGSCPKLWSEGQPPCPSYKHNFEGRFDLAAARQGMTVAAEPVAA
ncbi:SPASM domain-containing protein [Streptomyces sp. NPDC086549]|uniref:SPASM domain-containing protein n=1 Tax=Streptomyces sp. NPDC086549 TaxID=3365752 RepID=UPI0038009E56